MIDQFNKDFSGWARFSDDMTMRYRLARILTIRAPRANVLARLLPGETLTRDLSSPVLRIVWLLCNPSTADAFKPDPTFTECIKFSSSWGGDVCEIVNLWAWRSPCPADLKKRSVGFRGDDAINNAEILAACTGAHLVISAWGNEGKLDHRALAVTRLVSDAGIKLHHLGMTKEGYPKHPLARGKHRIPADQVPIAWA